MIEKGHILKVLKKVQGCLEREDYVKIKHLSNQVIHKASIDQDPDIIALAVIIYSLSKLIERESYKDEENEELDEKFREDFDSLKDDIGDLSLGRSGLLDELVGDLEGTFDAKQKELEDREKELKKRLDAGDESAREEWDELQEEWLASQEAYDHLGKDFEEED